MLCIHHFLFLALTNSVAILLRVPLPSSEIILELIFKASPFLSFFIIFCFQSCWSPHLMILELACSCLGCLLATLYFCPQMCDNKLTPVRGRMQIFLAKAATRLQIQSSSRGASSLAKDKWRCTGGCLYVISPLGSLDQIIFLKVLCESIDEISWGNIFDCVEVGFLLP